MRENGKNTERKVVIDDNQQSVDVLIIGAGIAGLTAAVYLARTGRSVTVCEQTTEIGGRARTSHFDGYYFNQGPHALYLSGPGAKILKELGIKYTGESPRGYLAVKEGKLMPLPSSLYSVLSSRLLKFPSKIEAVSFLTHLKRMYTSEVDNISLLDWMDKAIRHQDFAELLHAYFRLTSYANDPAYASAGSILAQLKMALSGGVIYIDGGWQTLVNGLRDVALNKGVRIIAGRKAVVAEQRGKAWIVNFSDTSHISASVLVIAASPSDAYRLFGNENRPEVLARVAKDAIPVKVASLDVALSTLPRPERLVVLSFDSPLYLSVHSAFGKLAPGSGAMIHVVKYLGSSMESRPSSTESELEGLLDLAQPGWRNVLVKKRFLPNMVVSNSLVTASHDGTRGRPSVKVSENLYIIGDWTGPEGMLSDASFSSARRAAKDILASLVNLINV